MNVLTDLKNRGVRDVFIVVCDAPLGLPDAVNTVVPAAIVQACVSHLIRATLRYASRRYWDQVAKDLRGIYTAPTVEAAWAAFEERRRSGASPIPRSAKMWRVAWEEFTPVPRPGDVEIRRVLLSTNATESLHARYRRAVTVRGHFPTEQAALKCLYLVTRGLDPTGTGHARWMTKWKPALTAFAVTFADRMPAAENL
jgi:putative transposase